MGGVRGRRRRGDGAGAGLDPRARPGVPIRSGRACGVTANSDGSAPGIGAGASAGAGGSARRALAWAAGTLSCSGHLAHLDLGAPPVLLAQPLDVRLVGAAARSCARRFDDLVLDLSKGTTDLPSSRRPG